MRTYKYSTRGDPERGSVQALLLACVLAALLLGVLATLAASVPWDALANMWHNVMRWALGAWHE